MLCPNCGETELVRLHIQQMGPEWRAGGKLKAGVDVESLPGTRALMMGQSGVLAEEDEWEFVDEDEPEGELVITTIYCGNCGEAVVD